MPLSCCIKLNANKRTICYGVVGIVWLVFGAIVFFLFESDIETEMKKKLYTTINSTRHKFNMTVEQYEAFRQAIREYEPYEHDTQWSFVGSLYFSITVVTTIGYGHVTPQTKWGKIFCIVYACLGIPLFLVMFQSMGERWNAGARRVFQFIGRKLCFSHRQQPRSSGCNLDGFMIPFGIFTCCLTVAVGSAIFVHYESWSPLDSIYYCVMTLTTIGFGDFVALQQPQTLNSNTGYVIFCFAYILLGLTLIGAFLNLVVLQKIVSVPQCNNNNHHRCNGGGRHVTDGEDARRRRRGGGAGSDDNYSGTGVKSFRSKKISHDKLGAEDESSRKSLDNAINTCENLHLTASNPTYSLTMLHERADDREKQRRLSSDLDPSTRMWHMSSGSKSMLDDSRDDDDDDQRRRADNDGGGNADDSMTSLSVNSDQETAQRLQNFKKTVMKLHERRAGRGKHRGNSVEPRKKFSMLLDICSRPRTSCSSSGGGNVGFRTPQNSRSAHYAVTEPCHVVTHSCEIETMTQHESGGRVGDLAHSRTTSWPLSHSSGEGKVDPRTVSWVRNTLDVLTAGAFADFSNQPGGVSGGGEKEKLCPTTSTSTTAADDHDLPSITVTSSALLDDDGGSPGSVGDNNVFVTPSPAERRRRSAEMLFLLPPITFGSPSSTRRYSGDSGYSGTQSMASTTSHRLITTKSSTTASATSATAAPNNSLLAASKASTTTSSPVCASRA